MENYPMETVLVNSAVIQSPFKQYFSVKFRVIN
jgi:hypothetical protein